MYMKGSKDLLSSVLKTTQMGQIGIRCVMDAPIHKGLHGALRSQLEEFDSIETQAHALAKRHGWKLEELDPAVRGASEFMVRTQLAFRRTDSKAAAMMIHGNTRGMIKGLKNLHAYPNSDTQISLLCQKLIDCESENIRQMQGYL